jgi:hypothetical protein
MGAVSTTAAVRCIRDPSSGQSKESRPHHTGHSGCVALEYKLRLDCIKSKTAKFSESNRILSCFFTDSSQMVAIELAIEHTQLAAPAVLETSSANPCSSNIAAIAKSFF